MIGLSRTFRPSHLVAAGFGLAAVLILGGTFALSATRDEPSETGPVSVPLTTEKQTTAARPTTSEIRMPPKTNRVRVECVELENVTRLGMFVNGRLLTSIGAASIGGFNQAALVASSSTGNAAGYFDNLRVRSVGS